MATVVDILDCTDRVHKRLRNDYICKLTTIVMYYKQNATLQSFEVDSNIVNIFNLDFHRYLQYVTIFLQMLLSNTLLNVAL